MRANLQWMKERQRRDSTPKRERERELSTIPGSMPVGADRRVGQASSFLTCAFTTSHPGALTFLSSSPSGV